MSNVTQVGQAMHAIFDCTNDLARSTGFVQRVRQGKLTGKWFAITQVFGLLNAGKGAMSDLSYFVHHSGMTNSEQGLHEQYTHATAIFLQELLNGAFTQVMRRFFALLLMVVMISIKLLKSLNKPYRMHNKSSFLNIRWKSICLPFSRTWITI